MEEDMSAKKKIIKITFGAAAIMMLLSGRNTAKVSAQTAVSYTHLTLPTIA